MKLLVTGAAGCLGRAVLARALAAGHQVRAVDLRRPETPVPGPEWVACDLAATDVHGLLPLASGCDAVVHLAALVHRPEIRDSTHYREINTELTARLIDAALSAGVPRGRFAFSSTVGVYGRDHDLAADEDTPVDARTPYARSKLEAERAVLAAGGLVMRFPVMYGAGDKGNIAQLIRAIASGRFALPGPCEALRSLVSSANAAESLLLALERGAAAGVYLVTDDDDRSVRMLAETIAASLIPPARVRRIPLAPVWVVAALGSVLQAVGVPMRVNLDALRKLTSRLTFSCARARQAFGYRAAIAFEAGVRQAVITETGQSSSITSSAGH